MPSTEHYQAARDLIGASLSGFLPEIILGIAICALLLVDLVSRRRYSKHAAALATAALVLAGLSLLSTWPASPSELFGWQGADGMSRGMLGQDAFGWFFKLLVVLGTLVVVPMGLSHPAFKKRPMGEYYALLLGASLGMFLMAGATNLLVVYLGIEFASLASYLLTTFEKTSRKGSEAGLKYVIYGSVASGVMIFGMSLIYGMTGSLHMGEISQQLQVGDVSQSALLVAGLLVFGGFAYKMASFPMHFWCPDVYEGAPTPVTAYLSVASKAAGFAVFVRFLMSFGPGFKVAFPLSGGATDHMSFGWPVLVAAVSAITMTIGNLAALWQLNVKRMLAWSSVAHAGYLLMGVAVLDPEFKGGSQFSPLLFYFIAYFVMNLGAFYVVNLVAARGEGESMESYRNLGYRSPWLAAFLTIFLVSLLGIPPTGGFVGKLQLFLTVIDHGMVWLAVVAGINTAISAYYYFRLTKAMYMEKQSGEVLQPFLPGRGNMALLGVFALAVLVLGVAFSPIAAMVRQFAL